MRKRFRRALAALLSIAFAASFYAPSAQAADLLKSAKVELSNPKAGQGSSYTFTASVKTGGTVKGIRMAFRKTASGSTQNPTSMSLASATLSATRTGLDAADWEIVTTGAASGHLYITSTTGNALNADDVISWTIEGITNPPIVDTSNTGCQQNSNSVPGSNASSGTCYVQVQTFTTVTTADMDTQGEAASPTGILLDKTTLGFAVTAEVSVSARVDSTLSFTVIGTAQGATAATAGATTTTTDTSTFSNLPFGNLTVGTPKTLAQKLYVKTNANNGYQVKLKSTTSGGQPLKGVYTTPETNVINPFNNNTGDGTALWGTPSTWAAPTSTDANTYSGFIGVSTSDTDIWAATAASGANSNKWAALNSSANVVMSESGPDLGAEVDHVQITFAIEVNVYQPADNYTGTMQYNCIPTY